jgi:hypothetical protein
VKAALADGATGLLQFQDGSPALSTQQWSQVDAALGSSSTHTGVPQASPADITPHVSGSYVKLTWNSVSTATGYQVKVVLPDGAAWRTSSVAQLHAVYDIVPTTGTYQYKVRAYNANGDGAWSPVQTFTVTR